MPKFVRIVQKRLFQQGICAINIHKAAVQCKPFVRQRKEALAQKEKHPFKKWRKEGNYAKTISEYAALPCNADWDFVDPDAG